MLDENAVTVAPVGPASAGDGGIAFPITGGEVDVETLGGTIDHSGGLTFSAVRGIAATLSDDAAAALNEAFAVELFEGGLPIGDVTVRASAG